MEPLTRVSEAAPGDLSNTCLCCPAVDPRFQEDQPPARTHASWTAHHLTISSANLMSCASKLTISCMGWADSMDRVSQCLNTSTLPQMVGARDVNSAPTHWLSCSGPSDEETVCAQHSTTVYVLGKQSTESVGKWLTK